MVDRGLQFARRVDALGRVYFISNPGDRALDGWVPLERRAAALKAFDPMTGRAADADVRGSGEVREVYLQIPPAGR